MESLPMIYFACVLAGFIAFPICTAAWALLAPDEHAEPVNSEKHSRNLRGLSRTDISLGAS
jgi:hypothetical protein